jgi:hypothetical protein
MGGVKIMKYYKDINNNVYAYELDGSQDELIGDKVAMTADEIEEHINPPITLERAQLLAKQAKIEALASVKVITTSGKVFDGRDNDQQRMLSVIISSSAINITETQWKLADNTIATVSLDELKEALALSIQAIGNIVIGAQDGNN